MCLLTMGRSYIVKWCTEILFCIGVCIHCVQHFFQVVHMLLEILLHLLPNLVAFNRTKESLVCLVVVSWAGKEALNLLRGCMGYVAHIAPRQKAPTSLAHHQHVLEERTVCSPLEARVNVAFDGSANKVPYKKGLRHNYVPTPAFPKEVRLRWKSSSPFPEMFDFCHYVLM